MSYLAAILNLVLPGAGTILAGFKNKDGKNAEAILLGFICLFFCGSIGWFVSLIVSYQMVKKARYSDQVESVGEKGSWFSTDQDYKDAADFKKSRFDGIGCNALMTIRVCVMAPYAISMANLAALDDVWKLIFYLTEWGVWISFFAHIASMKAVKFDAWQKPAVILLEMATCLDLIIVPLFWIVLAPLIFPALIKAWPADAMTFLTMITHHTIPAIATFSNLYFTDIKLLKKDWWIMLLMGVLFIPANYAGFVVLGQSLYPGFDWTKPIECAFKWFGIAVLQTVVYYAFARWTHRKK